MDASRFTFHTPLGVNVETLRGRACLRSFVDRNRGFGSFPLHQSALADGIASQVALARRFNINVADWKSENLNENTACDAVTVGKPQTADGVELLDTIDTAALAGDDDSWQRAKSTLIAVYQEMLKCPDLIGEQVNELFQAYKERLVENRRRSNEVGLMDPGEQKAAPLAVQANAAIAEINEIQ
jgi:hypothetical protein